MSQEIIHYSHEKGYYIAIAFAISNSLLNAKNILIEGSAVLFNRNSTLNLAVALISLLIYAYMIVFKEKHFPVFKKQLLILLLLFLFWLITYLINPTLFTYSYVGEELSEFIIYSLPALLFLPALFDCSELMNALYKCRWLMFGVACLSVLLMMFYGQIQGAGTRYSVYSMSFGRALMLPCVLFISNWVKEHKIIDLICSIICLVFILVFASRFPLLCIGCFVLVKAIQTPKSNKKFFLIFFGIVAAILLYLNLDKLLTIAYRYFSGVGINSRSLGLLTNGSFTYDSGRQRIITELIGKINESPIIGYGAGGGNVALNNGLSHSFLFDWFANLGYVIGGILLLIAIVSIINLFRRNKRWVDREFMIICVCFVAPICIFQMSMWRASYFWMLIALCCGRLGKGGFNNE